MSDLIEQIALPSDTYRALEKIAQVRGVSLPMLLDTWIQEHLSQDTLHALRQEYQELTDKELNRILTGEEKARLETVCTQINEIEMQSEASSRWQERTREMNTLLQDMKRTLASFPDKDTSER